MVAPAHPAVHSHNGYSVTDLRSLVLSMSGEREVWLARERAAYHRGHADGYAAGAAAGWLAAIGHVKTAQHGITRELARLPHLPSTRPRRGDYPGGERGLARVRASWAAWEAAQPWAGGGAA
jgi:hypothetical protein